MADKAANPGGACAGGMCEGKGKATFVNGVWTDNPVSVQMLGVCSALAVTSRLENSLVMGAALMFVAVMSNLLVSFLRNSTPRRIRMIVEVAIIASFVIIFDQILKAYYFDMSRRLGPYVGLIITNCIIMGRAEAFALQNRPGLAMVDGVANGIGYAVILSLIGLAREVLGTGGLRVFGVGFDVSAWYTPNQTMILAPGAFLALGFLIAIFNHIKGPEPEEESKP